MAHSFCSEDESLFNNKRFSDAVVKCGDREWLVHKSVVCTRSTWFDKALNSGMQESITSMVTIHDMEPARVEWLLNYLYSGKHDIKSKPGFDSNCFMAFHQAYELADYFLLDTLKFCLRISVRLRLDTLTASWANMDLNLGCQEVFGLDVEEFFSQFFDAVSLVYRAGYPNPAIRDFFVDFAVDNPTATMHSSGFCAGLTREAKYARDVLLATHTYDKYGECCSSAEDCGICS